MSKKIAFHSLLFLLLLFEYEISQNVDKDMMKALACIAVIKAKKDTIQDQRLITNYMLKCFISIDDSSIQKLLSNQMSDNFDLDKSDVDKLTDISKLSVEYSKEEISDFSRKLNMALEKLKNADLNVAENEKSRKSDSNSNKSPESSELLEYIINGFMSFLNPNDSFLVLIVFFVLAYFGLKGLKKLFAGNKKEKVNTKPKKDKKGKKD